jgi:hypothetical protein
MPNISRGFGFGITKRVGAVLPVAVLWAVQALAQSAMPLNNTGFSKETENPVTRQITLPLRYQADFLDGADKLTKSTFEIDQAVLPFHLNNDWSLITRTKLPAFRSSSPSRQGTSRK